MHKIFLPFLLLLSAMPALGQKISVPEHYSILDSVSGDLDNDNISEMVVAYNTRPATTDFDNIARELVIYKLAAGKWEVWKKSQQALLGSNDGGMMGDPYAGMELKNGVLFVSHYGGSSWRWGHTDKYRYQDGTFYLIGYTDNYGKICEEWTTVDFNLSTGKMVAEKEYQTCNEDSDGVIVTKTETETIYKKGLKITLENRHEREIKIVTPKYKFDVYVSTKDD